MSNFLQQTEIVAGQSSTASFPVVDQNGGVDPRNIEIPPGKTPSLPDNLATTDMLAQLVSGVLNLGTSDKQGLSLRFDGQLGVPSFTYGTLNSQVTSHLLGTTETGAYLTDRGNAVPEITTGKRTGFQIFTIQNARDGMVVPFPQQYADDNTVVFLSPEPQIYNGKWIMPFVGAYAYNRANFVMTRYFVDNSLNSVSGPVHCLAIGSI